MKKRTVKDRVAAIVDFRHTEWVESSIPLRAILEALAVDAYNLGQRDQRRAKQ